MKTYGNATIAGLLGDSLIFRSLQPVDPRLPGLDAVRDSLGIPPSVTPRKIQPQYGRVVGEILSSAQALLNPGQELTRLLYIGDTPGSDGSAFRNIARAMGCPGALFIGSEQPDPEDPQVSWEEEFLFIKSQTWQDVYHLEDICRQHGVLMNGSCAVVIDLDKTVIGARGRNDAVINQARVEAVRKTVAEILGDDFSADVFERDYRIINQNRYHPFTQDNQDYIAYVCLLLGSGAISREQLLQELSREKQITFAAFLRRVDAVKDQLTPALADLHQRFFDAYRSGDPTPFKAFRRQEYLETMSRFGTLPDSAAAADFLSQEIVLTAEVYRTAQRWKERGLLLFGLSDKPDEASLPTEEQAKNGWHPIHRAETHLIGHAEGD